MRYLVALGHDLGGFRLAVDCAGDGFLRCAIIEVLNFFVVGSLPMDEDADTDVEIVGLILGNNPLGHAVGNRLGDVSHAIQQHVESAGLSIVRTLVGHGIGRSMHEEPQIPNYGTPGTGVPLEEGMVLAVEPMVTAGRHGVRVGEDHWAIYSQDGSLAAHFEFTIAITTEGPRILTPWHEAGGGRAAA